jgi:hypothetical protein
MSICTPDLPTVSSGAISLRELAAQASNAGRHEEARRHLLRAEAQQPRATDVQIDLLAAEYELGLFRHAVLRADALLDQDPALDECRFVRALSQEALFNLPLAADELTRLVRGPRAALFASRAPDMAAVAAQRLSDISDRLTPCAGAPRDGVLRPHTGRNDAPRWHGVGPHKYDLGHLSQPGHQRVVGPIQDDEALLLYALVRVMRMRRVLEVGGLAGYSARNFLQAMDGDDGVTMYTVDLSPVPSISPWHYTIQRDCGSLQPADVHNLPLDLVFFDAHVVAPQLQLLARLESFGLVHANTVLALHDTDLHIEPVRQNPPVRDTDGQVGFVHQAAEREMVNRLRRQGWDALCFHMPLERCDERLGVRHGLTLMRKFQHLVP